MKQRAGKQRKTLNKIVALPEGLLIENDEKFYKDVRSALATSLGAGLLTQTTKQTGQRQLVYIRQPSSPIIQGREGPLPALPLFVDERQSAWLVVEIESEYGTPLMLKHISLKLWQGATAEAAHLCFRAEWDVRDAELNHAQPHWNVHAPQGITSEVEAEVDFEKFAEKEQGGQITSFAEFELAEAVAANNVVPSTFPNYGLSVDQMHKFHFAMSSNWHLSDGASGPVVSTTQEIVSWISSCALYIKHQFEFVMGR